MPNSPDDILFGAAVDDQTGKFFDDFHNRLTGLENNMKQGFAGIDSLSGKSVTGLAAVAGAVGGVASMISTKLLDSLGDAAQAVQNVVKESTMLAARNETLGVSMNIVGQNAGYSNEQMKEYEEGLKKTGISILESKQGLISMMQADLDLADAAKLARVSQDAAVLAGLNSSQTFERILRGITTLQPEILRGLNLEVNLQQAVEEYARKNNIAASSIDYATKKQILLNAVLEKGKSIAGSYEAAMTTVGKKLGSLERYKEDFKVLFGEMFLPAFGSGVDFIIEKLEDMKKWIEENHDALQLFGRDAKIVVDGVISAFEGLVNILTSIPGYIVDISAKLAQLAVNKTGEAAGLGLSDEELENRKANLGKYFAEAVSIAAGGAGYMISIAKQGIDAMTLLAKSVAAAWKGDVTTSMELGVQAGQMFLDMHKEAKKAADDAFLSAAKFTGAIKDEGDAAEDSAANLNKAAKAAEALAEATDQANNMISDFAKKMEEEMADLAIKAAREAQEAAMREAWELEDLARQHADRVAAIMENAAQSQQDAMQRHSEERIQIEIDLQRQLRDIRRRFEFEASELARARDAVGLLQLMRRNKQEVEDAKISARDRRQDSDRQYQLELRQIEARRRKALQDLAKQEAKEAEVRERARAREQQLRKMHDQWEEEDRRRKYSRQLADLLRQIQGMSGMTQQGLNILTQQWGNYFGNLINMATAYMTYMNRIIYPGATSGQQYNPAGSPGGLGTVPQAVPIGGGTSPSGVVGQAGQVSQMLADAQKRFKEIGNVSRVPAVSPRKSTDRKEIAVTVNGTGLDPYIQRVVAQTLFEIERNKG